MKKLSPIFKSRPARLFFTVSAILLSFGILAYLVFRQWDVIVSRTWDIRWDYAVLAFVLFSIDLVIIAWVWVWIINYLGARLSFYQQFRYFTISNLMKRLPGTVWYVAWRAQMYGQNGLSAGLVSLGSGIEMAIFIVSCVLVSVVFAIPLLLQNTVGIIITVILLGLSLGLFHPRLLGWLLQKTGSASTHLDYRQLLKWIAVTILTRLIGGAILFCMVNVLTPVSLDQLGYVIGCQSVTAVLTTALFFSPTNFGITEVSLSLLFSAIMPSPVAVIVAVFSRILTILFEITWALLSLALFKGGQRQTNP